MLKFGNCRPAHMRCSALGTASTTGSTLIPRPHHGQVPRLYFTARAVSNDAGKAGSGGEYADILGTGILVEQGGGIVPDGAEGRKATQHAGRPVLMSRAMRDFAGLDQVPRCFLSLVYSSFPSWLCPSIHLQLEPYGPPLGCVLWSRATRDFAAGKGCVDKELSVPEIS